MSHEDAKEIEVLKERVTELEEKIKQLETIVQNERRGRRYA